MNKKEVHICPILMRTVIWEDGKCTEKCDEEDCPIDETVILTYKEHDVRPNSPSAAITQHSTTPHHLLRCDAGMSRERGRSGQRKMWPLINGRTLGDTMTDKKIQAIIDNL